MVLGMVQLVLNAHPKYNLWNGKDNIPGLLCACALNETLDTSLFLYVISKAHTPSVMKQPDLKYFREALIVPFHLTCCSFVMTAFVHFECMASSREIQFFPLLILRLAEPLHLGMACTNH